MIHDSYILFIKFFHVYPLSTHISISAIIRYRLLEINSNSGFACESEPCTDEPNWLRELAHKQTYSSESVYGERRDNEQRKLRVVGMALCSCMPHFCDFFAY